MNQLVFFRLAFLPPLAAAVFILWRVPPLIHLYSSLALDLPLATAILFRWYAVFSLIPWLFVAGWVFSHKVEAKGSSALVLSVILSGAVIAFAAWAACLPMATLASSL